MQKVRSDEMALNRSINGFQVQPGKGWGSSRKSIVSQPGANNRQPTFTNQHS